MKNLKEISVMERYNKYGKLYFKILIGCGVNKINIKSYNAFYNYGRYIVFGYGGKIIFSLNVIGGDILVTRSTDKSSFEYLVPLNPNYNPEDSNSPLYKLTVI